MVIEIWKNILNYEGLYQVSNLGRVKGLKKLSWNGYSYIIKPERILRPSNSKGYKSVRLYKNKIAKKIIQYDKNMKKIKVWGCISNAQRELKIDHSAIIRCAKHKQNTAGGYKWEYSL